MGFLSIFQCTSSKISLISSDSLGIKKPCSKGKKMNTFTKFRITSMVNVLELISKQKHLRFLCLEASLSQDSYNEKSWIPAQADCAKIISGSSYSGDYS